MTKVAMMIRMMTMGLGKARTNEKLDNHEGINSPMVFIRIINGIKLVNYFGFKFLRYSAHSVAEVSNGYFTIYSLNLDDRIRSCVSI